MIRDLRTILEGWPYEPGKISVRKIIGRDGRQKIQMRIDLGLLQLETEGRPDGERPHEQQFVFDWYERRRAQHVSVHGDDEEFALTTDDCRELRQEAYLVYQRYLAEFVLEEYDTVERDTTLSLRMIDFCERYGGSDRDRDALLAQRPYVLMMRARARVYGALERADYDAALLCLSEGLDAVRAALHDGDDAAEANELRILADLRAEVMRRIPADAAARLRMELQDAVMREDYEHAARLRDRLKAL